MSMWYWSKVTHGKRLLISRTRSSQNGMVIEIPLDFVADVRCFLSRLLASSNANFRIPVNSDPRHHSFLDDDLPVGSSERYCLRSTQYSPSVFSRTTLEIDITGFSARKRAWDAGQ